MALIVFGINEKNRDKRLSDNDKILMISRNSVEIVEFLTLMGFSFPGAREKCVVSLKAANKFTEEEIKHPVMF